MKFSLSLIQIEAINYLREANFDSSDGLPEELFLFASSLVPLPNIDMLIVDEQNRILLSRRNDDFFDKSWHIPGGCIRYNQTMQTCVCDSMLRELGNIIPFDETPIMVRDVIRGKRENIQHPYERGHNISMLFRCYWPSQCIINNQNKHPNDDGYLEFFDKLPSDFLALQHVFDDVLQPWL